METTKGALRQVKTAPTETSQSDSSIPEWVSEMSHRSEELQQRLQSFVQEKPFTSVAIAVSLGFIGGMLMKQFGESALERTSS